MDKIKGMPIKKIIKETIKTLVLIYNSNPFYFFVVCISTLLRGFLPIVQLTIGKYILDSIISAVEADASPQSIKRIVFWVALELISFILSMAADTVKRFFQSILGSYVVLTVNDMLNKKAISLDSAFFENPEFYDLLKKAKQGAGERPIQILDNIFNLFQNIITLLGLVGLFTTFSPWMLIILIITTVPTLNVEIYFSKKLFKVYENRVQYEREKEYLSWMMTDKFAFKEVRLFSLGEFFINRFNEISLRHLKQDKSINLKRSAVYNLINILLLLIYYGLYAFIIFSAIQKVITIGGMSMYMLAIKQIQNGIRTLLQAMSAIYESNLYISNLFSFLEIKQDMKNGDIIKEEGTLIKNSIEFRDVSFKYPGSDNYVLKNVSFKINKGQDIAIVGINGSGKTTLVKLLCRFYDPTRGSIYFDGIDIKDYDLNTLRKRISTIFQDYVRYEMNVQENIGIGNIEEINNLDLIKECAEKSEAHEFIARLPNQYNEFLGKMLNNGAELSIGQWQRVALARAFMRDGDLLILDEPTASLDAESEYKVFQKFSELTKGKISIVISHRFSTVRNSDNVIVLKEGSIVEQGNHSELMMADGEYARLYKLQAEAYQERKEIKLDKGE